MFLPMVSLLFQVCRTGGGAGSILLASLFCELLEDRDNIWGRLLSSGLGMELAPRVCLLMSAQCLNNVYLCSRSDLGMIVGSGNEAREGFFSGVALGRIWVRLRGRKEEQHGQRLREAGQSQICLYGNSHFDLFSNRLRAQAR